MPGPKMITGDAQLHKVFVDGTQLTPEASLKLRNHSHGHFAWGYGGSGPAQLALAILLTQTTEHTALSAYQDFKREVVAQWPMEEDFTYKVSDVKAWLIHYKYNL